MPSTLPPRRSTGPMAAGPTAAAPAATAGAPARQDRRRFIGLIGGGFVVAAAPLASGCSTAPPESVLAPWQLPPLPAAGSDPRRFMLAHALLAPNPHNRQPWLADLRRPGEITLVCDQGRLLPETDPFGRQILIGCGAFIELAVLAGAECGQRVTVEPFPDGEPAATALPGGHRVARLKLTPDAGVARDPLLAQIPRRHTNKSAYDNARAVAAPLWQQLGEGARAHGLLAGAVTDSAAMNRVRDIARASWEIEMTTSRTWLESAHLLRIGPDEVAKHRDGITLMSLVPRIGSAVGAFDRFEVPARGSSNFQRAMQRFAAYETGSGFFWIASRGNSRTAQLASGRAYVRAHLQATASGLDMHPLSQALQEFAEVREPYLALHRQLGFEPAATTVQMLARVGYGLKPEGPSPRRDITTMTLA